MSILGFSSDMAGGEATRFGLDFEHVADLVCTSLDFNTFLGRGESIWTPLNEVTERGVLSQFYDACSSSLMLSYCATKLLQLQMLEPALRLLAATGNYATVGRVLVHFMATSLTERHAENARRNKALSVRFLTEVMPKRGGNAPLHDHASLEDQLSSSISAYYGVTDSRYNDIAFVAKTLRLLVDISSVLLDTQNMHTTAALQLVEALHLHPMSGEPSEWANVHQTVVSLPLSVKQLYADLTVAYYRLLHKYANDLTAESNKASLKNDQNALQNIRSQYKYTKDKIQIIVNFVLNRFEFVPKEIANSLMA
jgi:hypothetical protein